MGTAKTWAEMKANCNQFNVLAYDSDFQLQACNTASCSWQSVWEVTDPASNSIYRAEVKEKSNSIPKKPQRWNIVY